MREAWKQETIHPASIAHCQTVEEQQLLAGVKPDFIHLSIGIQEVEELIADLYQALSGGKEYAYHRE
ncbi:PLP-dependent transferase [Ectobacillus funiculus]|uniref:PLP-dependent transferase n=1 Tax=Ectobacillus funiculus TaxID=137993 RepID=UPI00101D1070|nr:PLP-dependent transferase [Ectobacillus funiculus]